MQQCDVLLCCGLGEKRKEAEAVRVVVARCFHLQLTLHDKMAPTAYATGQWLNSVAIGLIWVLQKIDIEATLLIGSLIKRLTTIRTFNRHNH